MQIISPRWTAPYTQPGSKCITVIALGQQAGPIGLMNSSSAREQVESFHQFSFRRDGFHAVDKAVFKVHADLIFIKFTG